MSGISKETRLRRFWSLISKNENGCFDWLGPLDTDGYGKLQLNYKQHHAHRWAWIMLKGEIPSGLSVCHTCDNRRCVNINHLFLGTPAENSRDMVLKGRSRTGEKCNFYKHNYKGENNSRHILTAADVTEIRNSNSSNNELAEKFSVSYHTIWDVRHNRSWGDRSGRKSKKKVYEQTS